MKIYKEIAITICFLILIAFLSGCNKYNHVYHDNLIGKVKSVEVEIYRALEGSGKIVQGSLESKHIKNYDENGYSTSILYYTGDIQIFKITFIANKARTVIESVYESERDTDTFKSKTVELVDNKRPVSIKHYINDSFQGETTFYTEDNKTYVGIGKDINGEIKSKMIREYQGKHQIKNIAIEDKSNYLSAHYFDKNTFKLTEMYAKDDRGERRYKLIYNDSGFVEKSINCSYDEMGGFKIGGGYNDKTSKKFYYKYELDSKQNWIKCIVYSEENNDPVLIKERKITYY